MVALNFPSSPSEGQKFSAFTFTGGLWKSTPGPRTALPKNYLVNGSMQSSLENANTSGSGIRYPADQWSLTPVAPAVITTQRVQVTTPNGSVDRLRYTVSTIDAAIAVGDYTYIGAQIIEGTRIADLKFGTAAAVRLILRFGFKAPAGTYTAALRNGAQNRSYVSTFTISAGQANTDTEQIFIIPGDTTGTWVTNTNPALFVGISVACGSTFHGTNNAWAAGNFFGAAGGSNGTAVVNAVYELFDVGLYADPYLTGKPPPWEALSYVRTTMDGYRYCYKSSPSHGGMTAATTIGRCGFVHPVEQRVASTNGWLSTGLAYAAPASLTSTISSHTAVYPNAHCFEFTGVASGQTYTVGYGAHGLSSVLCNAR